MRLIGHVSTALAAKRFCDYLLARGMPSHVEQGTDGQWQIWIEHDDAQDAGRAELARFAAEADDPRYDAAGEAERVRKLQYASQQRLQKNYRDVRTTMFTAPPQEIPAALTIIVVSTVVAFVTHFGESIASPVMAKLLFTDPGVLQFDSIVPHPMFRSVLNGELWRVITPAFIHFGPLHLIFNMVWMLDLGRRIEPRKGSAKFVMIALAVAVLSNLAQAGWTAVSPWDPGHIGFFGGMSGVVAGLFGYAYVCRRLRPYEGIGVNDQEVGYMIGWLVICSFGFVGPIANAAHWGGLVAGAAIGALPSVWKRR